MQQFDGIFAFIKIDFPFRVRRYIDQTFTDCDELLKILKNYTEIFGDYVVSVYGGDSREVNGYTKKLETTIREFWKEHNNSLFVRFG